MYKIRTMRHDAESGTGPVWTQTTRDPRITAIGRVLRQFHLDELPQLLNVVKGEMSVIGPRPERPEFVHVLAESIPGYLKRLVVRPGMTGLAQLNLPPDSDLNSVRRKLALDCEYIRRPDRGSIHASSCVPALRMAKVPERWLLHCFRLRRAVRLEAADNCGRAPGGNGKGPRVGSCAGHTDEYPLSGRAASRSRAMAAAVAARNAHAHHTSIKAAVNAAATMLNVFTVDVEDYFQVSAFEKHIDRQCWGQWESRVSANTHRVLELLDRHGVHATFFVLGWIAERHPQLVREIHACGHEIGSHGYWHRLIYQQSPAEFRADLCRSRDVLQEVIGRAGDGPSRRQLLDHAAIALGTGNPG